MPHPLDNPIWNALISGNKSFAFGSEKAKFIKRDLGFFAGLKDNTEEDLVELHSLLPLNSMVILFAAEELKIPARWRIQVKRDLLQMVYYSSHSNNGRDCELVPLKEEHIPAMLELTSLTKPGPFLARTIDFGNYEGIFIDDHLIAMAGQRLQPDPYTEISAVCTHPDHTGKGYAAKLIMSQVNQVQTASRIPFLHLNADNIAGFNLYKKLGFQTRKQMLVYVLESQ